LTREGGAARVGAVLPRLGLAAVVAVAVVAALLLPVARPGAQVVADRPGWPLAIRYVGMFAEGGQEPRSGTIEFTANGWDDWMTVTDSGDGVILVQRYGPQHREAHAELPRGSLEQPFAALEAAQEVAFAWDVGEEPVEALVPNPLLSRRYAALLEPEPPADATVSGDLPALRAEVAASLDIPAGLLRSARVEQEICWDEGCGTMRRTAVWLPDVGVPVYAEEIDPDGALSRMVATHLQHGLAPPPNPAPAPPPLAPGSSEPDEPVTAGGLQWQILTKTWSIDTGSQIELRVTPEEASVQPPDTLDLERWDGARWHRVAAVPVPAGDLGAPDRGVTLRVALPDDVEPGSHRLVTPDGAAIGTFWHAGDPNR
jgi:hypothetical protein